MPGSLRLNGVAIEPQQRVRVTVNSFLAGGGDNFSALKEGADSRTGQMDIDALEAHVQRVGTIGPGALDRIRRVD